MTRTLDHDRIHSHRRHRSRRTDRLRALVPDRLGGPVRARSAGLPAAPGDHPRAPQPQRHPDGAGGLRLPPAGRRPGDRPGRAGVRGADWVVLVGGLPRKEGMSRADLIRANGPIFTGQGKAINAAAGPDVRVLAVANPCNTNCLIARSHAPKVPADRWYAMTRLDQNRAESLLAKKAGVPVASVSCMTIWGNHSDTQYPDYKNARIDGRPATELIRDAAWFTETYIPTVAKRGAAVIKARGASSAASAANAIIDSLRSLSVPTPPGDWFSAAVVSDGSYGIPAGL